MKSLIQEIQKNKLQLASRKVMIVAVMVLGTSAIVNAQTTPEKIPAAKEVKKGEHKKEKKEEAKPEAKKTEAKKAEAKKEEPKKKH